MENPTETETQQGRLTKPPQRTEANSLDGDAGDAGTDELIACSQKGDPKALNQLLALARPRLIAVALRIVRDRDDAEDVVQESLLKVCRYLTKFEGRSSFTTWLHRIVVNTSLDRLRRAQTRYERPAGAEDEEGRHEVVESVDEETPERAFGRAEAGAHVQGAIARLSPAHREAIALRELDGESYQEIATIARCPVGTVMSRLHHARRRLAADLAPTFAATMNAA